MKRTASSRLRTTTLPFSVKGGSNLNSVIALSLGAINTDPNSLCKKLLACRWTYSDHIVRRQWPPDPLQLELAQWLDPYGLLDLCEHARTYQDLSRLGFIAEPRGDIGHGPDGGIVEAALKADSAKRSKAVRYADAKANVVPPPTPRFGQCPDGVAHFEGHQHCLGAQGSLQERDH